MTAGTRPSAGAAPAGAAELAELRAEHDALAGRLAARRSIDLVRRAAYGGFTGLIATGLAVKLAYDRWFSTRAIRFKGPPIYFFVALTIAAALLVATAAVLARARRLMREEDALFQRLRVLRDRLELDP